ncbi:hypothetical protein [Tissierella creatinophila]|uniref:Uncharacterized protein n=1 Tax=Tissierella creatinophila DSM 6911 TaxID=1123403 RepID=A0A1U7M4E7_TISCR|nr:hypothetical protein [Tissierella creatinophila]OLS02187.1 hypothetical protein TICRE_18450 [Tissierella creatinophila DSM 6911]
MPNYKTLVKEVEINIGNDEIAKCEKIIINATNQEEIRFSWWTKNGVQFQRTPLDLPKEQWLELFDEAVKNDVFSKGFIKDLITVLSKGL